MKQVLWLVSGLLLAIMLIVSVSAFIQANREELNLSADLQYRTRILADSLSESTETPLSVHATTSIERIVDRIANNERVVGLGVFDNGGRLIASSKDFPETALHDHLIVSSMDSDTPSGEFTRTAGGRTYLFAEPLHTDDRVIGDLVVIQNASYIDDAVFGIWRDNLFPLLLLLVLVGGALYVLVRWVFFQPLTNLTELIRALRRGEMVEDGTAPADSFLAPLTSEITKISATLRQARYAAQEEARMRLEKLDSPWTAERLKEFMHAYLRDRPIFVVSNSEPYIHTKGKNGKNGKDGIEWSVPAGGVVTALEPVMEACGGMWIARASGNADADVVDKEHKLMVPPDEPKYTLKRVFLSAEEVKGYYDGFSNEALWPLCHLAHVRPIFRAEDWHEYRKVNGLFAHNLLQEIRHIERPLILVQDYHLALLPALIKKSRPDAQVALFWHIPWPSAEQFSICPWSTDVLEGMLGADLIGFHTQQNCNDFMETVAKELESRIDYEHFSITRAEHETRIRPFPISIAFSSDEAEPEEPDRTLLDTLGVESEYVGLGVDRLDYTKGILERFKGIEFFLNAHPEYRGRFTFLQIGAPTRESIPKYQEYAAEVEAEAERINKAFGTNEWRPIVFERKRYSREELVPLYRAAHVCLVTSLHDGMNLVSKEYPAARNLQKLAALAHGGKYRYTRPVGEVPERSNGAHC
jgi:trehalose-6-phosphate synthase